METQNFLPILSTQVRRDIICMPSYRRYVLFSCISLFCFAVSYCLPIVSSVANAIFCSGIFFSVILDNVMSYVLARLHLKTPKSLTKATTISVEEIENSDDSVFHGYDEHLTNDVNDFPEDEEWLQNTALIKV